MNHTIAYIRRLAGLLIFLTLPLYMCFIFDFRPLANFKRGMVTVEHQLYGFSVEYPAKWKATQYKEHGFKGIDERKLIIRQSWGDSLFIYVDLQIVEDPTLEKTILWSEKRLSRFYDKKTGESHLYEISFQETTVNGHEAVERVYRTSGIMYKEVYLARSNNLILITLQDDLSSFNYHLEEFDAIVQSFRLLD